MFVSCFHPGNHTSASPGLRVASSGRRVWRKAKSGMEGSNRKNKKKVHVCSTLLLPYTLKFLQ